MKKDNFTRDMKYKKRFSAGKIIGLQNLIPGLAEKSEMVFFTENNMVSEIHEVDVESLRQVLAEDAHVLTGLWNKLLPDVLLLLNNHQLLELPDFLTNRRWTESI